MIYRRKPRPFAGIKARHAVAYAALMLILMVLLPYLCIRLFPDLAENLPDPFFKLFFHSRKHLSELFLWELFQHLKNICFLWKMMH